MSTPEQPLTRRQLREMQRTGSVPVLPPAAPNNAEEPPAAPHAPSATPASTPPPAWTPAGSPVPPSGPPSPAAPLTRRQARRTDEHRPSAAVPPAAPAPHRDVPAPAAPVPHNDRGVRVSARFGADLLAQDDSVAPEQARPAETAPPVPRNEISFPRLVAEPPTDTSTTSTHSMPSALILDDAPPSAPLSGPVTSTGEVLVTGSYQLPAAFGSVGHDPRTTDGREVDAVLIDGELPPASSPTPIAASAAISTVPSADEVIQPPVPEKGSRWIFGLAITAGVLAIAVVGLVIVAVMNGAFL